MIMNNFGALYEAVKEEEREERRVNRQLVSVERERESGGGDGKRDPEWHVNFIENGLVRNE